MNWGRDCSLPYAVLGALLVRTSREKEAEALLREAIKLDAHNSAALRALADARLRAGDPKEAVVFAKQAANEKDAPASAWVLLAMAQRGLGDKAAAKTNLDQALVIEPNNIAGLEERADLRADEGDYEHATEDLKAAAQQKPDDKQILT